MRILMLGAAAIALSGCSFLGIGGNKAPNVNPAQAGYYGQQAAQAGAYGQQAAQAGYYGQQASQTAQGAQVLYGQQGATYGQQAVYGQTAEYGQPVSYSPQPISGQQAVLGQQPGYYSQATQGAQSRCHSGNCLSRWNLEGGLGVVLPAGKNILTASRTNANPNTDLNSVSFGDAYKVGTRAELGGSYALAPNTKVSLIGHYEYADDAGIQNLGTIGGQNLTGTLSDYKEYGVEAGLRQYFSPIRAPLVRSVRPYVEGRAGIARVGDIELRDTDLGGAVFAGGDIPIYDDSWVGTGAALVGVETPIARYTTIGLETGIRYQGGLESDTSVLDAGTPLGGLNNNRGRYSIPVTLRGRYRF